MRSRFIAGLIGFTFLACAGIASASDVKSANAKALLAKTMAVRVQLSSDPILRAKQLKALRSKINAAGKAKSGATTYSLGGDECNSSDCNSGSDVTYYVMDTIYIDGAPGATVANEQLDRVVIYGSSTCLVEVSGPWGVADAPCDAITSLGNDSDVTALEIGLGKPGVIVDNAYDAVDVVVPVLPKCATTSTTSSINTPAIDETYGYIAAQDAIHRAFKDNWSSVGVPSRADVKYPNGDVVRFLITGKDDTNKVPTIERWMGTGNPDPKNNACK